MGRKSKFSYEQKLNAVLDYETFVRYISFGRGGAMLLFKQ